MLSIPGARVRGANSSATVSPAAPLVNPLVKHRADPWCYRHTDGYYYFTATVPEYDRIELRRSRSLADLGTAAGRVIWNKHENGPMSHHIWAPEIHFINGKWYIYFAAGRADAIWAIRMYVLECTGDDPLSDRWQERGQLKTQWESFSLDATTFEHRGARYLVWAQKDPQIQGNTNLYIARMNSPWSITGPQVMLTRPEFAWEQVGFWVNEGPAVLMRNNRLFLTYSASATDHNYCMGLLTASEQADLLDPLSWGKSSAPVFKSSPAHRQYGPGHSCFTQSPEGRDLLMYHARSYRDIDGDPLNNPDRHTRIQPLHWQQDGTPDFGEPVANGPQSAGAAGNPTWKLADAIVRQIVVPTFPQRDYPVTEFGAVAGGRILCTDAFHQAIAACHAAGGGRVVVPAGRYRVGAIHLQSKVNLHISEGATLLFSQNPGDYLPVVFTRWAGVECMNYSPFIYAFEQENIAITGKGVLDGQADNEHWWPWKGKSQYGYEEGNPEQSFARQRMFDMAEQGIPVRQRVFGEKSYLRPNFIQPYRCRNVLIDGITLLRSPMWEIHPVLCEHVTVRNVTVQSHGPNNDGCDPESCNGVLIENCYFDTGDDCIALKSGRNNDGRRIDRPIENVVIRNCRMKDGHGGVVIGSEISGGARNIFAEDCLMDSPNLDRMLRIKTNSVRGGTIQSIFMRNITVGEVRDAIFRVNFLYEEGDAGTFTPTVRGVHLENITARKSKYGLYLQGYDHSLVRGISLTNCEFRDIAQGNHLEHVRDIQFQNVVMNGKQVPSP